MAWDISFKAFLAFKISVEKSVILMGLSLYVTCHFSLAAFNFFLFSIFSVLTIVVFLSDLACLVF
jgi:hypothetical protein